MASRQEGTLLQEFCRIGKKWKKINKHKVFYVIKKEEICSVINPKNYGKKNLLAFAEKIGNFTLNVTMVDEAGNPLTAVTKDGVKITDGPSMTKDGIDAAGIR